MSFIVTGMSAAEFMEAVEVQEEIQEGVRKPTLIVKSNHTIQELDAAFLYLFEYNFEWIGRRGQEFMIGMAEDRTDLKDFYEDLTKKGSVKYYRMGNRWTNMPLNGDSFEVRYA